MRKICFRADASTAIGYGHFIRTLALADMLKDEYDCTFFTCHPTPYQVGEMEKVCPHVTLHEEIHYNEFLSYLQGDEIVVLDNYFFTTDYQRAIKEKGCRLVCIDDMHDKHYVADVVINHALSNKSLFDAEVYTQLCLGYDWALLRSSFLRLPQVQRKNKYVEKAVICFGGSVKNDLTNRFVSFLENEVTIKKIIAIVGDRYRSETRSCYSKVSYLRNLSASEISEVFRESDIAFVSASTVCLEALSQQIAVAAGYYVDNQEEIYAEYVANNLIYPLGDLLESDFEKMNYSLMVEKCKLLDTVDCSFVSLRYKRLFQNLFSPVRIKKNGLEFVDYRILDREQHLLIWRARNEDCIRSQMDHADFIPWESHLAFIDNLSSQYKKIYMAVYRENKLVGSVNIEYNSLLRVERGVFILPEFWGNGDAVLIENVLSEYLQKQQIASITAKVLRGNSRSLRFHLKLGYRQDSNDNRYDYLLKDLN